MLGNPSYPTYQVFIAMALAAVIVLVLMPVFIRFMRREGVGQQIRADGPQRHLVKQGTPTMGGVVILVALLATCVLMAKWTGDLILAVVATFATGSLGLLDDIESVAHKRSLGLTPSQKMAGLITISVAFCLFAVNMCGIAPVLRFPGGFALDLGVLTTTVELGGTAVAIPWLYLVFVFLLMAGLSNAVNLTDGLDGLAGGTVMIAMGVMAAICFSTNMLDLGVFAMAAAGACIGFLWFNCYPASIFMGDTGSLALGTAFAAIAVITKTELFSVIIGGIFVAEALSVIIQVAYFKKTRKRIFLMAPLHHHFEKKGWGETKVVMRFWIITALLAGLGFVAFFATRL